MSAATSTRTRVCHLVAPAPYGGLESVLEALIPAQAAAGHDVTVLAIFASDPAGQPFWESIARTGVRAIPKVLPGRQYRRERGEVRAALEATGAQVLHTHGYRPDVIDAPVARAAGVATVTTVHGFTGGGLRNRLYEWVQRRAFRRFDAVVAVSDRLREELVAAGVAPERVNAVRNAWRPSAPQLPPGEARERLGLPVG
ncbi:MAG: glycosyltransferase family 4 protein, partial [Gemmatimonadota bacterium]